MDTQQDIIPTAKIKITNKNISSNDSFLKDSNVGGPLLLNDVDQESLDNTNLMLGQNVSKQIELNFVDQCNLLENEHLSLNVDSILLTDNVKAFDHFNFELNEPETETLVCDLCLKSFQKVNLLIRHLAQHTGKYTCVECNKVSGANRFANRNFGKSSSTLFKIWSYLVDIYCVLRNHSKKKVHFIFYVSILATGYNS